MAASDGMAIGDDLDLAAALLDAARAAGADQADVLVSSSASVHIGVAGGALEEAEGSEAREAGLRVLVGQRQAAVSSSVLTRATLAEMAARAVTMAKAAPEDPTAGLLPTDMTGAADAALDLEDPSGRPDPAALEEMARAAEAAALATAGVTMVEQAYASYEQDVLTLAATNGHQGGYGRTAYALGTSAIAGEGLGRERDHYGQFRRHRADLSTPDAIGAEAARRAVAALRPRKPPGGPTPVVFDQRVASSLIGHLMGVVSGTAVARGASWLSDAMDRQILPAGFDIDEDPLIVRGVGSRPFDAEGVPSCASPIVQDGRLVRWVLDAATARKLGLQTTGNARRGLTGAPSPGVTNIRVTQSGRSRDDLLAEMGTGLLVTGLIGASVSPTTGSYSRGANGFWVERGEIAYPVNEITLAGMLPDIVRTIVPANDADPFLKYAVPSLLVEGLTLGA